jgi:hypothetical protein
LSYNPWLTSKNYQQASKRETKKVGNTFGRVEWTMDDFYKYLKLCNVGIDIKNNLNPNLVTNVELEEVFAKRGYNG